MSLSNKYMKKIKQGDVIKDDGAGSGKATLGGVQWKDLSEEITFKLR